MQLEQAKTLKDLTGGKALLTQDEAREIMGYDPMPESEQPAPEPAPAPAPDDALADTVQTMADDMADDAAQMKAWRVAALANVGQGVGAPFDAELQACASKSDVRAVFERHWPRDDDTLKALLAELRAAREALSHD